MGNGHRKRFGERIRALRLAKGFTQESLAAAAGLHPTYVGGIERGERNVSLDNILKLANALAIPPSKIFEEFGS